MTSFVFVSCQVGAEKPLKADIARHHQELAFAFSRPGFVTFKAPENYELHDWLKSTFVRACGVSVGSVKDPESQIESIVSLYPDIDFRHLHVWYRDSAVPGDRGFEPFHKPEAHQLGTRIKELAGESWQKVAVNRTAKSGDLVADLIVVEPDLWFAGWHRAFSLPSRWPGGVPALSAPASMVSRAYLKMEEALKWSRMPIGAGDVCVELGSSPGGSCQALLDRGLHVIGIDPAIMDERVMSHGKFQHVRARAADLKRKEFATARWLMADANIAPTNILDSIEDIVTHRKVNIQGMLLTLKLLDWNMAESIDTHLDRIYQWGFRHVRARQLAFNRQEVTVFAAKSKARSRLR